ncbi:MAG TPA: hypothetical protein VIY90_09530 [Steroidobacteraceae bacterium]
MRFHPYRGLAAINQKDYGQHNSTAGVVAAGLKAFIAFLKAKFPMQHGDIFRVANGNGMF